jgi:hypothetical protein
MDGNQIIITAYLLWPTLRTCCGAQAVGIACAHINRIFYLPGFNCKPIYVDLFTADSWYAGSNSSYNLQGMEYCIPFKRPDTVELGLSGRRRMPTELQFLELLVLGKAVLTITLPKSRSWNISAERFSIPSYSAVCRTREFFDHITKMLPPRACIHG